MMRFFGFGIGVYLCMGAVLLFGKAGWAQPEFQMPMVLTNDLLPSVLYIEHREDIGKEMLMISRPEMGYWASREVCRAPYMDVVISGKGGAMLAAGDSADNCYIYGLDLINAKIKQIFDEPVKNPWAGKRHREWIRTEPQSTSIYMAYDDPDSPDLLIIKYSYGVHEVEKKKVPKHLFGSEVKGDFHFRIAPDGQHVAFVTKPKAVSGKPGAFESTLRVLHFSNMTVTDATKSIVSYVSGGENDAWPAFDFQSPSLIHYFTMAPPADGSKTQITMNYKSVDVESNVNSEILSAIQAIPQNAGTLFRHPNTYYMLYEQSSPTPSRFWVDHENSRSILIYPEQGKFTLSRDADIVTVKCDNKTLYSAPNPANTLFNGVVSNYENRAFCIGSDNPAVPETQIWFYDPLENLGAAAWSPNKITLIGVLETFDPLKKKL